MLNLNEIRNTIIHGDARNVLIGVPDQSIQICVTSPPYWGLRDYGLDPVIWDGDPECQHVWGEHQPEFHKGQVAQTKWKNVDAVANGGNAKSGQFCQLCGAWLGTLGLEPYPALYIKHIVDIMDELKRVMRDDGTVWLNIGDSYIGGKGQSGTRGSEHQDKRRANGESINTGAQTLGGAKQTKPADNMGILREYNYKPKDLALVPFRLAIALQEAGWWIRSDIIFAKPAPMPESVQNRPTKSHEYIFLLTKSGSTQFWTHRDLPGTRSRPEPDYRWWDNELEYELDVEPDNWRDETYIDARIKDISEADKLGKEVQPKKRYKRYNLWTGHDYYYDAEAIMESSVDPESHKGRRKRNRQQFDNEAFSDTRKGFEKLDGQKYPKRNKRTVWRISNKPYKGAHFATMPPDIPEICIKAGTSDKACPHCGAAWARIVERNNPNSIESESERGGYGKGLYNEGEQYPEDDRDSARRARMVPKKSVYYSGETIGFRPSCQCENNDGSGKCIVLDPFAGSGTTLAVAQLLGCDYIGIEAQEKYIPMAEERIKKMNLQPKLSREV